MSYRKDKTNILFRAKKLAVISLLACALGGLWLTSQALASVSGVRIECPAGETPKVLRNPKPNLADAGCSKGGDAKHHTGSGGMAVDVTCDKPGSGQGATPHPPKYIQYSCDIGAKISIAFLTPAEEEKASLGTFNTGDPVASGDKCGGGSGVDPVNISVNIGCKGLGNPIVDMLFAVIRFLSAGVGLVIVGSIIVAGIQYTTSQGDPNATAKALGRIRSTVIALLIFIFTASLLNFVIPAGILK